MRARIVNDAYSLLLTRAGSAPIRNSVQLVRADLMKTTAKTRLREILSKRGGWYKSFDDGVDSIIFAVYTGVRFTSIGSRGASVCAEIDTPPGRARSSHSGERLSFWEHKKLMNGSLIALVWKSGGEVSIHLGTVASSADDLKASAKQKRDTVAIQLSFFDPGTELRILQELKHKNESVGDVKILLEATVLYESIRPFLEALRVEPELVPFSQYLVHHPQGFFRHFKISPPKRAMLPGFQYQLSSLFPSDAGIRDLRLSVSDPQSVELARSELKRASRLDPSQADALVDVLMREVALIQG